MNARSGTASGTRRSAGSTTPMSDHGEHSRRNEPVRVIDRRTFTPAGEPRQPDSSAEEPAAPLRVDPVASGPPPGSPAAAAPSGPAADPVVSAHFQNLVVNLARQAAANLGASRHPLSGQIEVDLEGAQQMIDLGIDLRHGTTG